MYSSFHSTSSTLASAIRNDIFSLLGNSGKTIFSPEAVEFSFSFRFFFSKSLRRAIHRLEKFAYRKPLTYLAICLTTLMVAPSETSFASENIDTTNQKTFIVTAYYSPIPGQNDYYRGSYEADVRLNGNGTHGASGTPVFTGMIAAPKTYAFGTQIFFDGLGLGTVQDRGGAIVAAFVRGQAYDRIDIWMGYGDAGLRRTIAWGRREVKGTIVTDGVQRSPLNISGIENGSVNLAQYPPVASPGSIGGLSGNAIAAFADLGYNFTGNDTKSMVIGFQLDHQIIDSKNDEAAGSYGPKTRSLLATLHEAYTSKRDVELSAIDSARKLLLTDHNVWQKHYIQAESVVTAFGQPRIKDSGESVRLLQEWLATGNFYTGKSDGNMNARTLVAIRRYQKSKNIKTTGMLDDRTRSAMIDDTAVNL